MPSKSEEAYKKVADALEADGAVRSQMFGMPCLKIGTKAFAGVFEDAMIFKLSGEPHAEALSLKGATLFDPMGAGRAMKEWVQVPLIHADRWQKLAGDALVYVGTSAAKKPVTKKAAAKKPRK